MKKLLIALVATVLGSAGISRAGAQTGVLSAGNDHLILLASNSQLYGWGGNRGLELGILGLHGVLGMSTVPAPRRLSTPANIRRVHTGNQASYAIDTDGALWRRGFGHSVNGGMELDDQAIGMVRYRPVFERHRWTKVEEHGGLAAGLDRNGQLWVWWNSTLDVSADAKPPAQPTPVHPNQKWKDFCIGDAAFYAIAGDGATWGANALRGKTLAAAALTLTNLGAPEPFERVICEDTAEHVLALDRRHRLWGFGKNRFDELGHASSPTDNDSASASAFQLLSDKQWSDVAIGAGFTLAITVSGELWAWGLNTSHQLGVSSSATGHSTPTLVDGKHAWVAVTAGHRFGAAMTSGGEVFTWGSNQAGALGNGAISTSRRTPRSVSPDLRGLIHSQR